MASGDRIPTTLISTELTTTASSHTYANASSSFRTQVTSIIITTQSAGTTNRTVTIYKGGTSASNERLNIDVDPDGSSFPKSIVIDIPFVLTNTEAIYVKQDVGSDINIEISGIVEEI